MKKIILLFSILYTVFNYNLIFANSLLIVDFNYATFYSPEQGPYIETYLKVAGETAVFKENENNKFQASLEVTLLFKQDGDIKTFKKYNLLSPEIDDKTQPKPDFIDLQRFSIPNGTYNLEVKIADNNSEIQAIQYYYTIVINYLSENICFSDIQLIESYTQTTQQNILSKSGYDLIPYISDFYAETINKLIFYMEIYNTNLVLEKNEVFSIRYFIETFLTNKIFNDYYLFQKQTVNQVNVILGEFPINNLPSGDYNLVIEVRNRNNELLKSKKIFFQRYDIEDYKSPKIDEVYKFNVIDEKPEFPGGVEALMKYIAENIRYPEIAKRKAIEGRVFVQFVINKNGKVVNVEIKNKVHLSLDEEALRVVRSLPNWTPGKQKGEPVNVQFQIPINFMLW